MMLRTFKKTGPGTIFLVIVVLISLWSGTYIKAKDQMNLYFDIDPMPFYGFISSLTGTHPMPGIILAMLLVAVMAFLMVNLNTALFFINERTFLPALFYVMLTGMFPQYQVLNPAIFGALFLMIAIRRIIDAYRVQGISYSFFDAGMLIAAGSLFYANLIWFGIITFIGISILRAMNPREILLSLLGIATPYLLTTAVYYVLGIDPHDFMALVKYNLFGKDTVFALIPPGVVALIFTSLLMLISLAHLFAHIGSKKIQSRKIFIILLWILVISFACFFLVPSVSVEMIYVGAIPAGYLLSHYFIFMKRRIIPEVFFALFFVLILSIQVWYIFRV